jgi:hypothetical protein
LTPKREPQKQAENDTAEALVVAAASTAVNAAGANG